MKYLALDTSNKFVIISLIDDKTTIYHQKIAAYRNASEITNQKIAQAFNAVGWQSKDLGGVVVTRGPGSFTGVRIGMTIAKVLATTLTIPLYTLSSMHYYAGLNDVSVILDARSQKVYYGRYQGGKVLKEGLYQLEDLENLDDQALIGEKSVLGKKDYFLPLDDHFLLLKADWRLESAFEAKPDYYKSNL